MEGKLLTIEDIAQAANVAKSTVSRVLNNSGYVGKETRERVEKVIAESNYTPWVTARNLSKQMSNTIGVVVSEITNPYFTRAFEGISEVIDKNDMNIILQYRSHPGQRGTGASDAAGEESKGHHNLPGN